MEIEFEDLKVEIPVDDDDSDNEEKDLPFTFVSKKKIDLAIWIGHLLKYSSIFSMYFAHIGKKIWKQVRVFCNRIWRNFKGTTIYWSIWFIRFTNVESVVNMIPGYVENVVINRDESLRSFKVAINIKLLYCTDWWHVGMCQTFICEFLVSLNSYAYTISWYIQELTDLYTSSKYTSWAILY